MEEKDKNNGLEELLRQNLELGQETLKIVKYIKRYVIWQRIFGILKFLFIVVPIILAIIYLPPMLKDLQESYKTLGADLSQIYSLPSLK